MCGLIAALGEKSMDYVGSGLALMKHRGIRQSVEYGRGWCLGHRRLPIVGVGDEYDQPVVSADGSAFAFVGELLD